MGYKGIDKDGFKENVQANLTELQGRFLDEEAIVQALEEIGKISHVLRNYIIKYSAVDNLSKSISFAQAIIKTEKEMHYSLSHADKITMLKELNLQEIKNVIPIDLKHNAITVRTGSGKKERIFKGQIVHVPLEDYSSMPVEISHIDPINNEILVNDDKYHNRLVRYRINNLFILIEDLDLKLQRYLTKQFPKKEITAKTLSKKEENIQVGQSLYLIMNDLKIVKITVSFIDENNLEVISRDKSGKFVRDKIANLSTNEESACKIVQYLQKKQVTSNAKKDMHNPAYKLSKQQAKINLPKKIDRIDDLYEIVKNNQELKVVIIDLMTIVYAQELDKKVFDNHLFECASKVLNNFLDKDNFINKNITPEEFKKLVLSQKGQEKNSSKENNTLSEAISSALVSKGRTPDPKKIEQLTREIEQKNHDFFMNNFKVSPNLQDAIRKIKTDNKQIVIYVHVNIDSRYVRQLVDSLDLNADYVCSSSDCSLDSQNHDHNFDVVLRKLKVKPFELVFVGDVNRNDIMQAGINFVKFNGEINIQLLFKKVLNKTVNTLNKFLDKALCRVYFS